MEDGDEKLELVEEKRVFDVEYEQNLLEGEIERSTRPLDFALDDVAINGGLERERERVREEGKRRAFVSFYL